MISREETLSSSAVSGLERLGWGGRSSKTVRASLFLACREAYLKEKYSFRLRDTVTETQDTS